YADIKEYASTLKWDFDGGGRMDFVPPGRQDESYSTLISLFNWQDFYERLGGKRLLDETQKKMREDYEYILIDSRTGVSDTSGICTIHMPDALVVCFTLNYQSINGASNVANTVLEEREKLNANTPAEQSPIRMAAFDIFPVPMRLEYAEKDKLDLMREYARRKFLQFPLSLSGNAKDEYWENTFAHYEAYYAYEELLAAFGEKTRGGDSLLVAAENLASVLTGEVVRLPTLPHPRRDEILAQFKGHHPRTEVADALVARAEKTFLAFSDKQQDVARQVLLRLVRVTRPEDVDGRNSRQRLNLKDFDVSGNQVIETLRNSQLLEITQDDSSSDSLVQISQDVLVQDWKRMREWIDADRDFLLWRQDLRPLVDRWNSTRSDESLLLRGARLDQAKEFLNRPELDVTLNFARAELDFIHSSISNQKGKEIPSVDRSGLHVFVVMPFGVKEALSAIPASGTALGRSAISINFDEIYGLLVSPALVKAGCVPLRADNEPGAGDISSDMYFELVTADVVLADISILNPNVFYELGVRHGVAPHGVLMINGGWGKRPFDVAASRTFDYEGRLFVSKPWERNETWQTELDNAVERLAYTIKNALDVDEQTIGSPVYKELVGLKPVDWSGIKTARAKYFGEAFSDWRTRVEVAKLNGWVGDILTLADDAPTRFHRVNLLWQAADALCSMGRFEAALPVLHDLLAIDPKHRNGLTRLGLVLVRMGKINEARVHMLHLAEQYKGDTEVQSILGRVYKDLWRLEWKDLEALEDRQRQAVAASNYVASAVRAYSLATREHFDYYNGINVVSFVKLLEDLQAATGDAPVDCGVDDLPDLIAVVRFTCQNALDYSSLDTGQDAIWASATLGELELVAGDPQKARTFYRDAANAPGTSYFNINSMLDQIYLFESLGFRPDAVAGVKEALELRRATLEKKIGGLKKSEPRFRKVLITSGHMIDAPDRVARGLGDRFPPRKEAVVRERIEEQLESWAVGAGDLAICGGARGADILFAEICADRGAEVWLFIALPQAEFMELSVRLPNGDWEERYFALRGRDGVRAFFQDERLKSPAKGAFPFARNNLWMINTARVEANDPKNLYALLVWDEKPTGDGPGGTSDFAERVKKLGGRLAPIINPTKL
ncbi:MAG TPA: tetratricopeptide repeat protein, partial [Pyrinomonadaceae bacterium]|nr:tetratricopeptide repeat protein [Pyrinomonadaceae bacterium]